MSTTKCNTSQDFNKYESLEIISCFVFVDKFLLDNNDDKVNMSVTKAYNSYQYIHHCTKFLVFETF